MRGERFKRRLPKFVGQIPDLDDTFIAEDKEFDRIDKRLEGFLYGLIPSLASGADRSSDYLARFERDYGLEGTGSIDDRISAIIAKIGANRVTTERVILDLCHTFGVEGSYYPDYGKYSFLLELRTRKDFSLRALEKAIREIIPAHLEMQTQIAVMTDVFYASTSLAGETVVISEPAPKSPVTVYPAYFGVSNVSTYEEIKILDGGFYE